jgi:hypothetical protein
MALRATLTAAEPIPGATPSAPRFASSAGGRGGQRAAR